MTEYRAVYNVTAGTTVDGEVDLYGLSPDQMAEKIGTTAEPSVSVCHQCADSINDPQVGELVAFIVDGVEYTQDDQGQWVATA